MAHRWFLAMCFLGQLAAPISSAEAQPSGLAGGYLGPLDALQQQLVELTGALRFEEAESVRQMMESTMASMLQAGTLPASALHTADLVRGMVNAMPTSVDAFAEVIQRSPATCVPNQPPNGIREKTSPRSSPHSSSSSTSKHAAAPKPAAPEAAVPEATTVTAGSSGSSPSSSSPSPAGPASAFAAPSQAANSALAWDTTQAIPQITATSRVSRQELQEARQREEEEEKRAKEFLQELAKLQQTFQT
eukprot:jgi/Mesvir1/17190/Mv07610-RA.1